MQSDIVFGLEKTPETQQAIEMQKLSIISEDGNYISNDHQTIGVANSYI